MDPIDLLEAKLDELLKNYAQLKEEKERLAAELQSGRNELEEENVRLKRELEEERSNKEAVLARIDGLLQKLRVETTD